MVNYHNNNSNNNSIMGHNSNSSIATIAVGLVVLATSKMVAIISHQNGGMLSYHGTSRNIWLAYRLNVKSWLKRPQA